MINLQIKEEPLESAREDVTEGARAIAAKKVIPMHIVPAEENIEEVEVSELEIKKPEVVGATVMEHDDEKVANCSYFRIF